MMSFYVQLAQRTRKEPKKEIRLVRRSWDDEFGCLACAGGEQRAEEAREGEK